MNKTLRKVLEWILLAVILITSVAVFLLRDKVQGLGALGYGGLFLLCFLSNCTVFLPAPSLLVVVGFARSLAPLPAALIGALGTALGEVAGYGAGHAGEDLFPRFAGLVEWLKERVSNLNLLIFLLAFLPLPLFDFAGVYAGASKMPLWRFGLLCFLGKALKMVIYVYLAGFLLDLLPI